MSETPDVHGHIDPKFERVRDELAAQIDSGNELGAAIAVDVDGELMVDLWGGFRDAARTLPWERDTIVNVWSTTKTMAALCVLMLADRGEVDLHAPVATYWPEFAAAGKEGVTVAQVMSHTAGLSGFDPAITPEDLYHWDGVVKGLAAQAPWWEPGSRSGYHAITQGYLQGEIVRQVTGRSIGTFFREEVAEPLGADVHIGLPASEDGRVADLVPPPGGGMEALAQADTDSIAVRTFLSCPLDTTETRTRAWRAAEIPAAGGTANARGVARVHSALACGGEVDGVRLLSEAGVERILEEQSETDDLVLGLKVRFGMGFGLMNESIPLSPSPRSFFWGGYGGSLAVTDLDRRMTVTYVMNKMSTGLAGDLRGASLVFAAYGALG